MRHVPTWYKHISTVHPISLIITIILLYLLLTEDEPPYPLNASCYNLCNLIGISNSAGRGWGEQGRRLNFYTD